MRYLRGNLFNSDTKGHDAETGEPVRKQNSSDLHLPSESQLDFLKADVSHCCFVKLTLLNYLLITLPQVIGPSLSSESAQHTRNISSIPWDLLASTAMQFQGGKKWLLDIIMRAPSLCFVRLEAVTRGWNMTSSCPRGRLTVSRLFCLEIVCMFF